MNFAKEDCVARENFILLMDEHSKRAKLLTQAAQSMYGQQDQRKRLIEQPFQLESERYQNLQAADWIAGLVGRLGAFWKHSIEYPENELFKHYFAYQLNQVAHRSGIWD